MIVPTAGQFASTTINLRVLSDCVFAVGCRLVIRFFQTLESIKLWCRFQHSGNRNIPAACWRFRRDPHSGIGYIRNRFAEKVAQPSPLQLGTLAVTWMMSHDGVTTWLAIGGASRRESV